MPLTILYAEDHRLVAEAVRDLLEDAGWTVDACADGNAAMNRIAGGVRYDLLLFDNELPGATGLELTRYARSLPMLSRHCDHHPLGDRMPLGRAARGRGLVPAQTRRDYRARGSRQKADGSASSVASEW